MLCHKCDNCDSSGYCSPGGDAYKKRMSSITKPVTPDAVPDAQPLPAVTPKASQKTPPTPAPKAPASVFNLADLT